MKYDAIVLGGSYAGLSAAMYVARGRRSIAVVDAEESGEIAVTLDSGEGLRASKLVLAFGIIDLLSDVPGLRECWGKSVLQCPCCHGYEFNDCPPGVLAIGVMATHQAQMIANWGSTTLFLNGREEPNPATLETLQSINVRIERTPVAALEGEGDGSSGVRLTDNRLEEFGALYIAPNTKLASPRSPSSLAACWRKSRPARSSAWMPR